MGRILYTYNVQMLSINKQTKNLEFKVRVKRHDNYVIVV